MHDYGWRGQDWQSIWVSYEVQPQADAEPSIRTAKSTATVEELKRQVGVAPSPS